MKEKKGDEDSSYNNNKVLIKKVLTKKTKTKVKRKSKISKKIIFSDHNPGPNEVKQQFPCI